MSYMMVILYNKQAAETRRNNIFAYFPSQNLCIFPNAHKILESGSLQERLVRCVLCKVLSVSKVRLIDWALEAFYENFKHFKSPMTTVSALISRFQQTVSFGTFNFNVKIKTLFNSIELVRSPQLNGQYFAKKKSEVRT